MKRDHTSNKAAAHVTIRVSGKLFSGHLDYLNQLVESATECSLWPMLSLAQLEEIDREALHYLILGEGHRFALLSCPDFIRAQMNHERERAAA
jgi:hypothetical protein